MFRAPLWLQLVILWAGTILLSATLIGIDFLRAGPYRFFWLIPYPNWRLVSSALVSAFRAKPLLATAGLLIPALAILATVVLVSARLLALLFDFRRTG